MDYGNLNLRYSEKVLFLLRSIFEEHGYSQYKVSKFEEYDLYMKNKSFLVSENVLTFTDTTGRLMALKPDVTLSIIKNTDVASDALKKVYYSENVYRTAPGAQGFREMMQTGLECIGNVDLAAMCEVLKIASDSLFVINPDYRLDLSHMGFLAGLLEGVPAEDRDELVRLVAEKNVGGIKECLTTPQSALSVLRLLSSADSKDCIATEKLSTGEYFPATPLTQGSPDRLDDCKIADVLCRVAGMYLPLAEALPEIEKLVQNEDMAQAVDELKDILAVMEQNGMAENLYLDFTMPSDMKYYNGIIFKGYVKGIPNAVLSGGRYDNLLAKMGKEAGAIGFAVYMNELEGYESVVFGDDSETEITTAFVGESIAENKSDTNAVSGFDDFINVALPKGRLGEKAYEIFEKAGYDCPEIKEENRKLVFENAEKKIRYFWVKPSDVSIYVERGAADIGIAGKDILLEYAPDVYELCDLGIGKCRMAVAGPKDFFDDRSRTLKVATKFPNITKEYYASLSREIDIIELHGSIELAPILGLSDVIVDIVETGSTLKQNGLEPLETVAPVSARLISNKVSYKFKHAAITALLGSMKHD